MVNRVAPHFWAVFWNLVSGALIAAFCALGAWYQGALKAEREAGVHLDPVAMGIASLPTWLGIVLLAVVACLLVLGVSVR
jgi:uncharacterized membrane protein